MLPQLQESLLNLKDSAIASLPALLLSILLLFVTNWGAKFIRKLVSRIGDRTVKSKSLRSLFVQLSYVAAWTVGIFIVSVVAFPDLRLGDIISLLGFGSVAIGFAFQDIFKNFLAGVLLLLQQPFQLGDEVIIEGYQGTVEDISIRSTQIRTYQGKLVVLPNALVFTSPVEVLTNWKQRETVVQISIDYNTPITEAIATLLEAVSGVAGVMSEPAAEINISDFVNSAILLSISYWTAPQMSQATNIKNNVMLALKKAGDRASIDIAYPTRGGRN